MNEDLLPTKFTIDQGNLIREVIKSVKSTSPLQKNGYKNCTYTKTTST